MAEILCESWPPTTDRQTRLKVIISLKLSKYLYQWIYFRTLNVVIIRFSQIGARIKQRFRIALLFIYNCFIIIIGNIFECSINSSGWKLATSAIFEMFENPETFEFWIHWTCFNFWNKSVISWPWSLTISYFLHVRCT